MRLVFLILAILVLLALLTAAGAFAWFVYRLADALPQRADELRDRIDAVRAINELRDQLTAFDEEFRGDLDELRESLRVVADYGWKPDVETRLSQHTYAVEERVEALDLRLQRAIATISGTGLVRFENDGEPR
jgi:biopolymer transport protein ExbB/TolQ